MITVEKMIEILKTMPSDARVVFFDTWWESEGWGDNHEWNEVDCIDYNEEKNRIELY